MDLLDWIAILFRRWWLTVPLLLLTLIGVGAAAFATPWTYEAKATAVLLASPTQAKQAGGNPWLVFDGSLTVTAEVVGRELMADQTVTGLRGRGLTAEYQLGVAADSGGPVLAVDVTGTSPGTTKATLDAVLAEIPRTLDQLQVQEGVKDKARIKVKVITSSPEATLVPTKKVRTLVMLLFMGIVFTVAVPLFVEVMVARRAGRGGLLKPSREPQESREPEPVFKVSLPSMPEPLETNGSQAKEKDAPEYWEYYLGSARPGGSSTSEPDS